MDTSKFDELVGHLAMFLLHQASPHTPVSVEPSEEWQSRYMSL